MIRRKQNKYRNKPCTSGGEKYRSQKEKHRHQSLLLLERAGLISNLRREVSYILAEGVTIRGKRKRSLRYIADFVYMQDGSEVVEDAKGVRTEGYRIKRHLLKAIHGIDILET